MRACVQCTDVVSHVCGALPQAAADHKLDKQSAKEVQSFIDNQVKIQQVPAERRTPPRTGLPMHAHADAPLQHALLGARRSSA